MGKFSGILLACDVDGTLVKDGILSDENAKAIEYFISEGGLFTVATGRTPEHIKEHYMPKLLVNAPMLCINGTAIADEKSFEILWEKKMPNVFGKMIEEVRSVTQPEKIILYKFSDTILVENEIPEGEFYKILFVTTTTEEALSLKEKLGVLFPECHFSRSWHTGLEATCVNAGKGIALKKLKEITKAKLAIGMGNFENDLTLLESADYAASVSDASDDVKAISDFITENDAENGVAEFIYKLEEKLQTKEKGSCILSV